MNTTAGAQRIILLSAITVLGIEILKKAIANGNLDTGVFVGGGITYTILSGVSEFAPAPAAAFSGLIAVAVLLKDGGPVLQTVLNGSAPPVKSTANPKQKTTMKAKVTKK